MGHVFICRLMHTHACIKEGSQLMEMKNTDQWSAELGSRLHSAILSLPDSGQVNSPCQVLVVSSYFKGFISTLIFYISLVLLQFFLNYKSSLNEDLAHEDPWLSSLRKLYFITIKVFLSCIVLSLEFYMNYIKTLFFTHFDWGMLTH